MNEIVFGDARVSLQLWDKLEEDSESGCWIWFGRETPTGWPKHARKAVWRTLYAKLVGPIPPQVSMLCDSGPKTCCNPYHRLNPYGGAIAPHTCGTCGRLHNPGGT